VHTGFLVINLIFSLIFIMEHNPQPAYVAGKRAKVFGVPRESCSRAQDSGHGLSTEIAPHKASI